jgi:UDP-glucose 4-epimerase
MRHVLVTGGSGLVGKAIVSRLLEAACQVMVVSRRALTYEHPRLHWLGGDLTAETGPVWDALPQVDDVVHAAATITDGGDPAALAALAATNIRATARLFDWCARSQPRRVVFLGSLSVLARPLRAPISESHPLGPNSPYAMSKLWGEELLMRQAKASDFAPIVLRISSPLPETFADAPRTVVRKWIEAAQRGEPLQVFGSGSRTQDFVASTDVAEAVWRSLDSAAAGGVYHVGSGTPLSMLALARTIAAFRDTPIELTSTDNAEQDRWLLALDRARRELGYVAQFTSQQAIERLAGPVLRVEKAS